MSNELAMDLMCIAMRNGVELWMESDKANKLQEALQGITQSKFVRYEGQTINTADIVGVFNAKTMEEYKRRKNGEWQCRYGNWHDRQQECSCRTEEGEATSFVAEEITDEQRLANMKALEALRARIKAN